MITDDKELQQKEWSKQFVGHNPSHSNSINGKDNVKQHARACIVQGSNVLYSLVSMSIISTGIPGNINGSINSITSKEEQPQSIQWEIQQGEQMNGDHAYPEKCTTAPSTSAQLCQHLRQIHKFHAL